ncbi:hypothetical protein [Buchananella hordeovulneris]|uniref:hypothetical protein n=1 Tax=Buchananella hordeovulneris TaxID=52770 RepID=UPI000F5FB28B|nr:hypothetical protein [Buchananella hordeovulneris]RRD43786.1 hypothetical protein EII13_05760 [Buchananella hordeovulneris]
MKAPRRDRVAPVTWALLGVVAFAFLAVGLFGSLVQSRQVTGDVHARLLRAHEELAARAPAYRQPLAAVRAQLQVDKLRADEAAAGWQVGAADWVAGPPGGDDLAQDAAVREFARAHAAEPHVTVGRVRAHDGPAWVLVSPLTDGRQRAVYVRIVRDPQARLWATRGAYAASTLALLAAVAGLSCRLTPRLQQRLLVGTPAPPVRPPD